MLSLSGGGETREKRGRGDVKSSYGAQWAERKRGRRALRTRGKKRKGLLFRSGWGKRRGGRGGGRFLLSWFLLGIEKERREIPPPAPLKKKKEKKEGWPSFTSNIRRNTEGKKRGRRKGEDPSSLEDRRERGKKGECGIPKNPIKNPALNT